MLRPRVLALLALPLAHAAATYPKPTGGTVTGTGLITVLVNTTLPATATTHSGISLTGGSPSQAVGCLNAAGRLVLDDCAEFRAVQYHVATAAGPCSFRNASAPTNADAVYGKSVHAFTCWTHAAAGTDTQFYTVAGLPYMFIGQGDIDLYYDLPALPEKSTDEVDFWYYVWGSQQTSVPPGHYQALLLWEPTS